MTRPHPYLAIRGGARLTLGWLVSMVGVVLLAGADLPVQRLAPQGTDSLVEPSAAGPLLLVVPALVAVHSWREPLGDLAVPSGRSLLWIRFLHGSLLGTIAAFAGWLVASQLDELGATRLAADSVTLTAAGLLSAAALGAAHAWLLPSLLIGVQLLPFPMPLAMTTWAYDAGTPREALMLAVAAMLASTVVAAAVAPRSLLGSRSALAIVAAGRE